MHEQTNESYLQLKAIGLGGLIPHLETQPPPAIATNTKQQSKM